MGPPPGTDENRSLARALMLYLEEDTPEKLTPLTAFLDAHPQSSWRASLLTNIGIVYRRTGYFTRALEAWEEAWRLARHETSPDARCIADRALGELAELNARLGRYERLEALFSEIGERDLRGPATRRVQGAREGLAMMRLRPDAAFRCGPMALSRILAHAHGAEIHEPRIFESRSTSQGMSLAEIARLSDELGMDLQMARRAPGAALLVPAVAHWRAGHFAALTREEPAASGKAAQFLMQDPTFDDDIWMSREALEAESSGYFLVRKGKLPEGWSPVGSEEGEQVWGKGNTGDKSKGDPPCGQTMAKPCCDDCGGGPPSYGMPEYNFHMLLTSLVITDTPIGYAPARGPSIYFTMTYNHGDAFQPALFSYSNLGHKWTFDWLSYVVDDPTKPNQPVSVYLRGSGMEDYKKYDASTGHYESHYRSDAVLVRTSPTSYERRRRDGSKEVFSAPDGARTFPRKLFLTQIFDRHGNAVNLSYDASMRLVAISDALGQVTTLEYGIAVDPLKISKITDPFGRAATLEYNGSGQLVKVTDAIRMTTVFHYAAGDFIDAMTTPYGTTRFRIGANPIDARNTWIEATDPLGNTERVEYRHDAPGIRDREDVVPVGLRVLNGYLNYRNSFFWDKQAWREHPGDYTKAQLVHWLHGVDTNVATGIRESEKSPLEGRVWYGYPGQASPLYMGRSASPSHIARVLDDGTTQLHRKLGSVLCVPGPQKPVILEVHSAGYSDGNFARITWNGNNLTTGWVKRGINVAVLNETTGELLANQNFDTHASTTNSEALATFLDSQPEGRLIIAAVMDEASKNLEEKAKLAFEALGATRIRQLAWVNSWAFVVCKGSSPLAERLVPQYGGPLELALLYGFAAPGVAHAEYDPMGRISVRVYDSSETDLLEVRQFSADGLDLLDQYTYDGNHRLLTHRDASGGVTTYEYDALGRRTETINPKGERTHRSYDDLDRLVQMVGPLGASISYTYDAYSRVRTETDVLGVTVKYDYDALDRRVRTTYPDGTHEDVVYEYLDPVRTVDRHKHTTRHEYNALRQRISSTDPTGRTTNFVWNRSGKLQQMTDPKGHTTTWKYDIQGRLVGKVFADGSETQYIYERTTSRLKRAVDQAGRTTSFEYNLDDNIKRVDYTGGVPTPSVSYTYDPYYDRQKTMQDGIGTTTYTYNPPGVIGALQLTSVEGPVPDCKVMFSYDELGRRISRVINGVASSIEFDAGSRRTSVTNVLGRFDYSYADSSPLLSKVTAPNGQVTEFTYYAPEEERRLKDITTHLPAGTLASNIEYRYQMSGNIQAMSVTTPSGKTVDSFIYDSAHRLTAAIRTQDTTTITTRRSYRYDEADNRTSEQISGPSPTRTNKLVYDKTNQILMQTCGGSVKEFSSDLMGNPTSDGTRIFEWDSANRLAVITTGTRRSEFSYDGFGRRTRVIEKIDGAVNSDRWFVWDGYELCEERDVSSGTVVRRFFEQGMQEGVANYYYSRDHLGSIRDILNVNGSSLGYYDYGPSGQQLRVTGGGILPPFEFARLRLHEPSGLYLAIHRAYDPLLGRWLNRDPRQEYSWRILMGLHFESTQSSLVANFETGNPYTYSDCNPINMIDPLGLQACPGDPDCKEIREYCIEKCTDETLPTGTNDGAPFFACMRKCMDLFGCPY